MALLIGSVISFEYLKRVLFYSALVLGLLLALVYAFESVRFVPGAKDLVKDFQGPVYFYRTENSALVFYSNRCIEKVDSLPSGEFILVVKGEKDIKGCFPLLKGREFEGVYTLQRCRL